MFDDLTRWFSEKFDSIIDSIVSIFWDSLAYVIDAIPVPDFLLTMGTITIPSNVSYFADYLEFTYGISIVTSAYVARFVLRRIPGIG